MLKKISLLLFFVFYTPCAAGAAFEPDQLLEQVIAKYGTKSFSASFTQKTTLKSMDMTDTASGFLIFKAPYKMRWSYYYPEFQEIVSNGKTLWIYAKKDNQVTTGKAEAFFKNGRGGSFLTDIKNIKKNFSISFEGKIKDDIYRFKLLPVKENSDISSVYLSVSMSSSDIVGIATYNVYDDENIFEFKNTKFLEKLDDLNFDFSVPKDVEVIYYDDYPN